MWQQKKRWLICKTGRRSGGHEHRRESSWLQWRGFRDGWCDEGGKRRGKTSSSKGTFQRGVCHQPFAFLFFPISITFEVLCRVSSRKCLRTWWFQLSLFKWNNLFRISSLKDWEDKENGVWLFEMAYVGFSKLLIFWDLLLCIWQIFRRPHIVGSRFPAGPLWWQTERK